MSPEMQQLIKKELNNKTITPGHTTIRENLSYNTIDKLVNTKHAKTVNLVRPTQLVRVIERKAELKAIIQKKIDEAKALMEKRKLNVNVIS